MNKYNSTEDFLLNTQTWLRDLCSETSKSGQMGTKESDQNEEGLKLAKDAALQLGAHSRDQPKEGRKPVAAFALLIWGKQRNLVSTAASESSRNCG